MFIDALDLKSRLIKVRYKGMTCNKFLLVLLHAFNSICIEPKLLKMAIFMTKNVKCAEKLQLLLNFMI